MADFEHYNPNPADKHKVKATPHEKAWCLHDYPGGEIEIFFYNNAEVPIEVHFRPKLHARPDVLPLDPSEAASVIVRPEGPGNYPCQTIAATVFTCPHCGAKAKLLSRKPAWEAEMLAGTDGGTKAGSYLMAERPPDGDQDGDPVIIIHP